VRVISYALAFAALVFPTSALPAPDREADCPHHRDDDGGDNENEHEQGHDYLLRFALWPRLITGASHLKAMRSDGSDISHPSDVINAQTANVSYL
jgi:hypothetical protein